MVKNLNTVDRGTSISIGALSSAGDNSIVLNATGTDFHPSGTNAFYVKPIRYDTLTSNMLAWNKSTGEIIDVGEISGGGSVGTLQEVIDKGNDTNKNINFTNNVHVTATGIDSRVDIGHETGVTNGGLRGVAIGSNAGNQEQDKDSVAIGTSAGRKYQNSYSVAVGHYAGYDRQDKYSVAVGNDAGRNYQNSYSVAIGSSAGLTNQGENSIAIGAYSNALSNSIVLNATGTAFHPSRTDGFFVNPIAIGDGTSNILEYSSDKQILDTGVTVASIKDEINQEIAKRIAGDELLQDNIDNGDVGLQSQIDNLGSQINNLTLQDVTNNGANTNHEITIYNNLIVTGNLQVNGTETIVNTEKLLVEDPIIELANNLVDPNQDVGIIMRQLPPTANVASAYIHPAKKVVS